MRSSILRAFGVRSDIFQTSAQSGQLIDPFDELIIIFKAMAAGINEIESGGGVLGGQPGTSNQLLRNVPSNIQTDGGIRMVSLNIISPAKNITVQVPVSFFQFYQAITGSSIDAQNFSLPVETAKEILQDYMKDGIISAMLYQCSDEHLGNIYQNRRLNEELQYQIAYETTFENLSRIFNKQLKDPGYVSETWIYRIKNEW
ncbi:hypothetical protein QYM36_001845, partial [Artemia franciscana]